MKELSKSESLLNEYIMNTSELSSSREHIYTQQSINNNLNLKLQNRKSTIKKNPFDKFSSNSNKILKLDENQTNNLINAIECNNMNKIKEYLEKDSLNINELNDKGISPLHIAVINGNMEIIKLLLDYGANPNIRSLKKKQTPLHLAYIFKCLLSNQIINLLINNKANPNLEDINNKKPFEYSLKYKESNEVENTLTNENESEEIEIGDDIQINPNINKNILKNIIKKQDSYKDNKNNYTYTISDSEQTINQTQTKRNTGYFIEELIKQKENINSNNGSKIKIIGKKSDQKLLYNKNNYNISKENNSILNINNNYFLSQDNNNILNDSLDMCLKKEIFNRNIFDNNYNFKTDNNLNKHKGNCRIFQTKKLFLNRSHKDLRMKKDLQKNKNSSDYKNFNKDKEINIREQYFFNNEFYNNYYNDKDNIQSKGIKKSFKIPKNIESRSNSPNHNSGLLSSMSTSHIQTSKKQKPPKKIISDVTEFLYQDDICNYKDSENSQNLKNWLSSIDLPFYDDNFIHNNISDINTLINEAKLKYNKINYDYIENLLKIHKSGHIFRILCKLEVDAERVENKICNFLVGLNNNTIDNNFKNNKSIRIQTKEYNNKCFNCYDTKKPLIEKKDLKVFLRKYNLLHLYDNFYHNGFDLINYVILQMYTKFSIDDAIIQKCLHIYKKKDRYFVLDALFNEVKEINIFFSTNIYNHCLFPKYENNDWSNSFNDESINTDNDNSNKCIII